MKSNKTKKKHNYDGHRIWHFIKQAKDNGEDSINFYRPVSVLANMRYEDLAEVLTEKGYIVSGVSNPNGSLVGIMQISKIQEV